jgi:hypothetical protein
VNRRQVVSLISFFCRHLIASVVSLIAPIILVVITYLLLFVIAIVGNYPLGSPVALPFWILFTGIYSFLVTAFLLFPAVSLSELISTRISRRRLLAQAGIAIVILAVQVLILAWVTRLTSYLNFSYWERANIFLTIFLILCLHLGLYWWIAKLGEIIFKRIIGLLYID